VVGIRRALTRILNVLNQRPKRTPAHNDIASLAHVADCRFEIQPFGQTRKSPNVPLINVEPSRLCTQKFALHLASRVGLQKLHSDMNCY
jgi:hypothetical protein